ncbi:MAG: ABC transporter ATP-binding protein [Patescibacteria group bacterium]
MKNLKENRLITVFRLSKQAFGEYKVQIFVLAVLSFFSGILGGVGVNALVPLFSFVSGQGKGDDFVSLTIEKIFLFLGVDFRIKYLLVFVCLLFILQAVVMVIFSYVSAKITLGYEEKTKSKLFSSILKSNWSYLLKEKLGHLETVLVVNVRNSSGLLGHISGTIMVLFTMTIYILIAINISVYITLSTLILGLLFFLIVKPFIYKARMLSYEVDKINKDVSHHINENILGMKTVKSMFVQDQVGSIGKNYFVRLRDLGIKFTLISASTSIFVQPASLIFICIVFVFSYRSPSFNLAALIAVVYLIKQIFSYFEQLQKRILNMSSLVPFLKKVLEYKQLADKHKEEDFGQLSFNFENVLEFKNISFFYEAGTNILNDLCFSIKKGEMIGLIGHSGAGKTTIIDLLLRLFQPGGGEISVDGVNIESIRMREWRNNVGYISQDMFLKNGTIMENIKFYNEDVTDQGMEEAAKMANIYDFIQTLPNKFSTLIGERGVLLSAGQRQRIVIARVLARKPKILIMDEATSALDNESELKIQKIIEDLKGKITVLVVAHRLSTIVNSDRLLVIDKGKIIEEGRPEELLKDKETYFYKVYNIRK